jgi:cobalamin synthase
MQYTVSTIGPRAMKHHCDGLADVVDVLAAYWPRVDCLPILHDLLSGLETVVRIDDVWLVVTPLHH